MDIDGFLDLARKRRSIRVLKSDPVPDEWIQKILEAGRWAMSGANSQPWEYIVVKDQKIKEEMGKGFMEVKKEADPIERTRVDKFRHPLQSHTYDLPPWTKAPVVIVICGDRRASQASVLFPNFLLSEGSTAGSGFLKGMANTAMMMHLAAAALGLGSQWMSITRPWEHYLRSILDVPIMIEIHSMVVVGYPDIDPPPGFRRELKDIVHYEKFDMSKYRKGQEVIDRITNARADMRKSDVDLYDKK